MSFINFSLNYNMIYSHLRILIFLKLFSLGCKGFLHSLISLSLMQSKAQVNGLPSAGRKCKILDGPPNSIIVRCCRDKISERGWRRRLSCPFEGSESMRLCRLQPPHSNNSFWKWTTFVLAPWIIELAPHQGCRQRSDVHASLNNGCAKPLGL